MKLISCHIENFGKLHDWSHDFTSGSNVFCEDNGWGKSTLASFIKVMFYGFSGDGKHSDTENERHHYMPWQKGVYGGNIVFESDGRQYRIERVFGEKKSGSDEFTLFDDKTNLESHDLSEKTGEDLFGIDSESFVRTVFVAQQDCGTSMTAGINAKMGSIANETADMGNYEEVQARLKKESDSLTPRRSTGQLSRLKSETALLGEKIRNKDVQQKTLDGLKSSLVSLQEQRNSDVTRSNEIQTQIKKLGAVKDLKAEYGRYMSLKKAVTESEENMRAARSYFPKDVPGEDSIDGALHEQSSYESAGRSAADFALNADDSSRLHHLEVEFAQGVPNDGQLTEEARDVSRLSKIRVEKAGMSLSESEEKKRREGEERFSAYRPDLREIDDLICDVNDAVSIKAALSSKKANAELIRTVLEQNRGAGKHISGGKIAGIVLIVIGALSVAVGFIGGVVIAAAGIAVLIIGIRSENKKRAEDSARDNEQKRRYDQLMDEIEDDEDRIRETEDKVRKLFDRMNLQYDAYDAGRELHDIRQLLRDYGELEARCRDIADRNYDGMIRELRNGIISFAGRYNNLISDENTDEELAGAISQIKSDTGEYMRLKNQSGESEKARNEAQKLCDSVRGFIISLGMEPSDDKDIKKQLTDIRDNAINLSGLSRQLEKCRRELEEFTDGTDVSRFDIFEDHGVQDGEKGASEVPDEVNDEETSLASLTDEFNKIQDEIDDISGKIQTYRSQIDDASEVMEQISNDEDEYERLNEEQAGLSHEYEVIERTRRCLEQAKINFTAKYMNPIKSSFDKYYGMISHDGAVYELDANLNIKVRESGSLHDIGLLSEGYKDLVGLCRRMAMVDAMYSGAKPFLVFDDPFVNLDDVRLAGAMRFLDSIAKEYQVIYLVCSSGRR